jgi:hypothetical protein
MFAGGKPPMRGTIPISVQHGLVKKFTASAAEENHKGRGAFDATLEDKAAAGMWTNQTLALIAYYAIRGSARAAINSMQRLQETVEVWSTPLHRQQCVSEDTTEEDSDEPGASEVENGVVAAAVTAPCSPHSQCASLLVPSPNRG